MVLVEPLGRHEHGHDDACHSEERPAFYVALTKLEGGAFMLELFKCEMLQSNLYL